MKACPICGSLTFDDAAVCYGCLHRYGETDEGGEAAPAPGIAQVPAPGIAQVPAPGEFVVGGRSGIREPAISKPLPVSLLVSLVPQEEAVGKTSWRCEIALAE